MQTKVLTPTHTHTHTHSHIHTFTHTHSDTHTHAHTFYPAGSHCRDPTSNTTEDRRGHDEGVNPCTLHYMLKPFRGVYNYNKYIHRDKNSGPHWEQPVPLPVPTGITTRVCGWTRCKTLSAAVRTQASDGRCPEGRHRNRAADLFRPCDTYNTKKGWSKR